MHQYSQAWFDFRGKRDKYADYFQNSAIATDVHRRFCMELAKQFPDYSDDLWGITASDSRKRLRDLGWAAGHGPDRWHRGAQRRRRLAALSARGGHARAAQHQNSLPRRLEPYGFVNAFNPLKNWYDSDVIGIDTGITMLMAENARTGFVWETFMKNPEAQRGMERAGFQTY